MGKRSNFERVPRDFYPTPYEAVIPLIPFVLNSSFYEPCCGDGRLSDHLVENRLTCVGESDLAPGRKNQITLDAMKLEDFDLRDADYIITNPPWDRKILHPMIDHFRKLRPTWLLFDSDWMHTKQSHELIRYCSDIVSVGRLKWIPDSKMTGKDNCCWYKFLDRECETKFHGR